MRPPRSRRLPALAVSSVTTAALALAGCSNDPGSAAAPASTPAAPSATPAAPPAGAGTRPSGTASPSSAASPAASTGASAASAALPTGDPQVLATGLEAPWGLAFLPGGDALVSERDTARVLRVPAGGGSPVEVDRLDEAAPSGEGGLLGLAVSPTYASDGLVYAYVTTDDDNRIVRFRLGGPRTTVLDGIPAGTIHNGGRLAFGPDGSLYAGTGDTGDTALARDPGSLGGKVLRMTPDGDPVAGASSLVFSTGHRNVQGLAFDDAGRLWATEFGQNTYDEVNQVRAGDDGGWPEVEGPGDGGGRFAAPRVTWDTSQASPSGATVAGGSLYVAALRGERLWRVPLDGRGGTGEPRRCTRGRTAGCARRRPLRTAASGCSPATATGAASPRARTTGSCGWRSRRPERPVRAVRPDLSGVSCPPHPSRTSRTAAGRVVRHHGQVTQPRTDAGRGEP